jgi:hypothetical protein
MLHRHFEATPYYIGAVDWPGYNFGGNENTEIIAGKTYYAGGNIHSGGAA